jgi:hypothetical protein
MVEEGAHGPAMMLPLRGESQCRTDQPSHASGSGLCKTVTGSLARWPARCWVRVRGTAVGHACTASRLHAAARIAPAQRPGGRGAAGGGKGRVHCLYSVRGTRAAGPHPARDATLRGRGAQGAVRLLPALALGRRAGGHVQPGEVSPQEEMRTWKKVLKHGGRDGAIRDAPASVRRPQWRPVMTSRRP